MPSGVPPNIDIEIAFAVKQREAAPGLGLSRSVPNAPCTSTLRTVGPLRVPIFARNRHRNKKGPYYSTLFLAVYSVYRPMQPNEPPTAPLRLIAIAATVAPTEGVRDRRLCRQTPSGSRSRPPDRQSAVAGVSQARRISPRRRRCINGRRHSRATLLSTPPTSKRSAATEDLRAELG